MLLRLLFLSLLCTQLFNPLSAQQNLVPNPSFEDTLACPMSLDGVSNLSFWFSAKFSPDYFNPCAEKDAPYVSVPSNVVGYQEPFDGKSYVGLATYYTAPNQIGDIREVLETPLIEPLSIGIRYYVSAYISSAAAEQVNCFSNNFGFKFTNVRHSAFVSIAPEAPIDNYSHIRVTDIVTDTSEWVWVGGSFVADSAYQYLMLGNFYTDDLTDTSGCREVFIDRKHAYYYVDKVFVSTDSTANSPTSSSVNINPDNSFYVFPNPAVDKLHIKNHSGVQPFILFNALGEKVKYGSLINGVNTIEIDQFERGIYFFVVNHSAFKVLFIN